MVRLVGALSKIRPIRALVVGDFLLDSYTFGKAQRISPEAPVAIVQTERQEYRPGGAGNVVLNLLDLNAHIVAVGRTGADYYGKKLREALLLSQVDLTGLIKEDGYPTPLKNRIISDHQQIVRIDHETIVDLQAAAEKNIVKQLPTLLEQVDIVAISDYGKGFLTPTLLKALFTLCQEKNIPTVTDPKGLDFSKYQGTSFIKPNEGEAYAAAGMERHVPLDRVSEKIFSLTQAQSLLITRADKGITLFSQDGTQKDFPVRKREVVDVTGAGDTTLAMIVSSLANDISIEESLELANVAAGIAIEHVGCARISLPDLARRLLVENASHKVFDENHLFALYESLRDRHFVVLELSAKETFSSETFLAIHNFATQHKETDIVVYLDHADHNEEWIDILKSLRDVQFIVLQKESLEHLCQELHPHAVYWMENAIIHQGIRTLV